MAITYYAGKSKSRLNDGSFALIDETASIFWTTTKIVSNYAEIHPSKGAQKTILQKWVLDPPRGPFLAIIFSRNNVGHTFRLNTPSMSGMLVFSGAPLRTIAPFPIWSVQRSIVADLLTRFPKVTAKEWQTMITSERDRYISGRGRQAVEAIRHIHHEHPGLSTAKLPALDTAEAHFLRYLAP